MSGQPNAKIEIRLDQIGRGTVKVNGLDLSSIVRSTQFISRAGALSAVELEIPACEITAEIEAALRVYMVKTEDLTAHGDEVRRFQADGASPAKE